MIIHFVGSFLKFFFYICDNYFVLLFYIRNIVIKYF